MHRSEGGVLFRLEYGVFRVYRESLEIECAGQFGVGYHFDLSTYGCAGMASDGKLDGDRASCQPRHPAFDCEVCAHT